jgi:hypothetical protein
LRRRAIDSDPFSSLEATARTISGSINRVTGDLKAVSIKMNKHTFVSLDVSYSLKCRPAQRKF